jgi:hypothetical protein
MDSNRYAPPQAALADPPLSGTVPHLWNPNTAACLSLLFTPVFGAWVHMRNWQTLGDEAKVAESRTWILISVGVILALAALSAVVPRSSPAHRLGDFCSLALLLGWYFASARSQIRLVKERFGAAYPRRAWARPLLAAIGLQLAFLAVIVTILAFGKALVA